MSTRQDFSTGLAAKFCGAWCEAGGTPEEMNGLAEDLTGLGQIISERRGLAIPKTAELLLEPISTVAIPATTKPFVAKDKFKLKIEGEICFYLGDNFTEWFLGKTEDPITEQVLRYAKLRKSSLDTPIIAELGGKAKAETTLTEMFSLMKKQGNGKSGVLLNNGYANIFYIKDQKGVLRAVGARWYGGGWDVRAGSVEDPGRWGGGYQVFSRNS